MGVSICISHVSWWLQFLLLFPFHGTNLDHSPARLLVNGRTHSSTLGCPWSGWGQGCQSLLHSFRTRVPGLGLSVSLLFPQSQNKAKQCKESATEAGMRPWPLLFPQLVLSHLRDVSPVCHSEYRLSLSYRMQA